MKKNSVCGWFVLVLVLVLGLSSVATATVTFTQDIIIATGNLGNQSKINIAGPGQVDVAWISENYYLQYTYWENGNSPVTDAITPCNVLAGIGRGNGKVKIGRYYAGTLSESSKSVTGGSWSTVPTGYTSTASTRSCSYAVNPVNGYGGFVFDDYGFNSTTRPTTFIEDNGSNWSDNYQQLPLTNEYTCSYPDLVYASDGTPYIATNYAKPNDGSVRGDYVGPIGDLLNAPGGQSFPNYKGALAVDSDGTQYFLNVRYSTVTRLHYKLADGSWTNGGDVTGYGFSGSGVKDPAIAIGPDGQIAALVWISGDENGLRLATKESITTGAWEFQALGTDARLQDPDIKYDYNGDLYLTYYDQGDEMLHLLTTTTVPEPGTIVLMLGGGMFGLLRRKRKM